jgi:hypothetical protein
MAIPMVMLLKPLHRIIGPRSMSPLSETIHLSVDDDGDRRRTLSYT